jgi:hypothetical protein
LDGTKDEGIVKIQTKDKSKLQQPLFTVLLCDKNHTLRRDHQEDFMERGLTKIYTVTTVDFEKGTLQLWMRHDCRIVYHSPLYGDTCTTSNHTSGFTTKELVQRHISIMLESIRCVLLLLQNREVSGPRSLLLHLFHDAD